MYLAIVALTMAALPILSILVEHGLHPLEPLVPLIGRWFVFWGVGVRLGLAALRQILQPGFTAKAIFHMSGDEAAPLIRELGAANAGTSLIALLSLAAPAFVAPAAISAALFFGAAGWIHVGESDRSLNETVAMVSDLFLALVLVGFLAVSALSR